MEPIDGTEGDDTLTGTTGNDTLSGLGGDDLLEGGDGNDSLRGGDGNDKLLGETGDDQLWGDAGNDTLLGAEGQDALFGGAGDDVLDGGEYAPWPGTSLVPWLNGGPGNDTLDNGLLAYEFSPQHTPLQGVIVNLSSSDQVVDGLTVLARTARDEFGDTDQLGTAIIDGHASQLDDVWFAPDLGHYVFLRQGDDLYYGSSAGGNVQPGAGNDTIYGASDLLMVSYSDKPLEQDLDGSAVQGVIGDLATGMVQDGWGGIDSLSGVLNLNGSSLADRLSGNAGNNFLGGDAGNDTLTGSAGNDNLNGRDGSDTAVFSGISTDYSVSRDGEFYRVTDNNPADGDDGSDTLQEMEILRFADRGILLSESPAGNNTIDLRGPGGGAVEGGRGNDLFIVDDPGDEPVEASGQGVDTVRASLSWVLGANLENLVLTGTENLVGTGNALANTLTGNAGDNTLDGGAGPDTMRGGAGNDRYLVDDIGDRVVETAPAPAFPGRVRPDGSGSNIDTVVAQVSYTLRNNIENLELAGGIGNEAFGNTLANELIGNVAANLLQGKGGDDTLYGGTGIDVALFTGPRDGYSVVRSGSKVTVTDINTANGDEGVDVLRGFEALRFADTVQSLAGTTVAQGTDTGQTFDLRTSGAQAAAGGDGNDTYLVNARGDAVIELANAGTDLVRSAISWKLWEYVENLQLTGGLAADATGNQAANQITGNSGANTLTGLAGADTLSGGGGSDALEGGTGNDSLTGGAGSDAFVFDSALGAARDTLTDFEPAVDRIHLDADVFTALRTGALEPKQFYASATATGAQDLDDRIVYNTTTGMVYYDADGTGSRPSVAFAVLSNQAAISAADFLVVT